jgi:hypothetical protein
MLDQPLSQRLRALREARDDEAVEPPSAPAPRTEQRLPLGRLLVEKGAISEAALEEALERQRTDARPLGQILLGMGAVTQQELARTLTEQHGFDFSASLRRRLAGEEPAAPPPDTEVERVNQVEPPHGERYLVREPDVREPLHVADSFLDAADAAFELIEEHEPDQLEIVRSRGGEFERLWSYRRDDALPLPRFSAA